MAESTVRTDNGSQERVAFDLYSDLIRHFDYKERESFADLVARRLAVYEQCLRATKQGRVDTSSLK